MENAPVLIGGIVVFLGLIGVFAWSTLSESGRRAHERSAAKLQDWPRPPRTAFGRWASSHPWWAAATVSLAAGILSYSIGRLALGDSHRDAAGDAVFSTLQWFLISALVFHSSAKRNSDASGAPSQANGHE